MLELSPNHPNLRPSIHVVKQEDYEEKDARKDFINNVVSKKILLIIL